MRYITNNNNCIILLKQDYIQHAFSIGWLLDDNAVKTPIFVAKTKALKIIHGKNPTFRDQPFVM